MTLAQRLLLAIGVLTIVSTAALGFGVREAWRRTEDERFVEQGRAAFQRVEKEIQAQVRDLPALVGPLCAHDPMVDSALVGLQARDLDSRRLSLSLRVPELMKALRLNELVLVTHSGEILGAGHADELVGTSDGALAARMRGPAGSARLRTTTRPLAVEAFCIREARGNPKQWVGLYAARHLDPTLDAIATAHGVELSLTRPSDERDMVTAVTLPELGVSLFASQSRVPLTRALRRLDWTIGAIGAGTLFLALSLSVLLSRGLARPIVQLSREAREVVSGEPKPVKGGGGRELQELASSFNQAIFDLTQLRKRLAATERIAARREIARRVAHEIKNPLAPIRAAIETLRRLRQRDDPAFDEYFDEATRTVLDEVARITHIVGEFTEFARLPPPNPAPMDLEEVVRHVISLHSSSGAELIVDAMPCPPLNADRDQMVQVLTNLVQNAIDAARGSDAPQVHVAIAPVERDRLELRVRDNGPGVAPEMRDRLFQPYATNKAEGTGLGLAIVERIVVEHGGEIGYTDAPGGGAEFRVTLPVAGPGLLAEAPASSSRRDQKEGFGR